MAKDEDSIDENTEKESHEHHEHHSEEKTEKHDQHEAEEVEEKSEDTRKEEPKTAGKHKHILNWYMAHKKLTIPLSVVIFLNVLFAVPFIHYSVLGLFLKQTFGVVVVDSETGKPISSAEVTLRGKTATTDGEGKASLKVAVGQANMTISKAYYRSTTQEVVVPVTKPETALKVELKATGRPVPVSVTNKVGGKPLSGVVLSAGQSKATTDDKGQAVLVIPAEKKTLEAELSANGFNKTTVTITAKTQEDEANKFQITPAGKIYFLSDQSGKIDVVKSDLDGSNRETVVAGTGKESKGETVLLATRDWKYLALLSKRDGGANAKLFAIDTSKDSIKVMDEGDASFRLSGWDDHYFVYRVTRNKLQIWQPKRQALKSYNADTKKLTTLDQTIAYGNEGNFTGENLNGVFLLDHKVVYVKDWTGVDGAHDEGKAATLNTISPAGGDKKIIKKFTDPAQAYYFTVDARIYGPDEIYVYFNALGDKQHFYEYQNGKLKARPDMDSSDYYEAEYATYLASPSGKKTFWSQVRDGRQNLLVGNADGGEEKRVAALDKEYQVYGWYSEDYLLVSRDGSELFIMSAAGVDKEDQLLKITDYYKPYYSYYGYGGGYGGL